MIIDVHGHLVPPDLLATIRKDSGRFASLRVVEDGAGLAIAFADGKPSRPIMKGLSDVAGRLAWMAKRGIDRHVVGGWPDWFGYELPAAEGEEWARQFNDAQLAAAKAEPRFVPLASLPLQDGARAGAVLKAAMAAGFPGAMISTLPRGIGSVLDAPDLDPFWAAADETGALIHIHPSYDAGDARGNDYGLAHGVGLARITFTYDAANDIRNFTDGLTNDAPVGLAPWQGSGKLGLGPHTVVVTALDKNGNTSTATIPVVKVATLAATLTPTFKVRTKKVKCKKRVCAVAGSLSRASAAAGVTPSIGGKVGVEWQFRNKKGQWRKLVGGLKPANKPFSFKAKLKLKGKWRVRFVYQGQAPWKKVASKYLTFTVK